MGKSQALTSTSISLEYSCSSKVFRPASRQGLVWSNMSSEDESTTAKETAKVPAAKEMQKILAEKRMAQQQAQVDEVVGIMSANLEKVLERDSKLTKLDERADALQSGASQFEKQAGKLKQRFWMENTRWVILILIIMIIIGMIIYYNYNDIKPHLKNGNDLKTDFSSPEVVLNTDDTKSTKPNLTNPNLENQSNVKS